MLALGAYDLVARGRLHRVHVAGVLWMIALQLTALLLLDNLTWKSLSSHVIGH